MRVDRRGRGRAVDAEFRLDEPAVDDGQNDQRKDSARNNSGDDDGRQRALHLGSGTGAGSHWHEADASHKRGHDDRAETLDARMAHALDGRSAMTMEFAELGNEHHAIEHGNAGKGNEPDGGGNRKRHLAIIEPDDAADRRKRHSGERRKRIELVAETDVEQADDEQQRDRHDECETLLHPLPVLKLTAPLEAIAIGHGDLGGNSLLALGDEATDFAAAYVALNRNSSLAPLTSNQAGSVDDADVA